MKSLSARQIPLYALIWLIPLLIFSYHPVISLGMAYGLHLDISLLYVALLVTVIANILSLWQSRRVLAASLPWKLGLGFIIFCWISTLWSPNSFRAVITVGFLTLLFGLFSAILIHSSILAKKSPFIKRLVSYGFIFAAVLALWQIISDALHIAPAFSLLPTMYNGSTFGIARPTAFALEPQFFGSLLLIPFLYSGYKLLRSTSLNIRLLFGIATALLLLTLSRGAILAAVIGLIILTVLVRPRWNMLSQIFVVGFISIAVTLLFIAGIGSVRKDSISGYETVRNVISQLTLGTVSLPLANTAEELPTNRLTQNTLQVPEPIAYVESSTDSRLSMSKEALNIWSSSPSTLLFGVGIGGFGMTLQNTNADISDSSVVNNFYIEQLAETGIVGLLLFINFIGSLLYFGVRKRQYLLVTLIIAFLIQWFFFSGTANVIHIWLILGLIAAGSLPGTKSSAIHKRI